MSDILWFGIGMMLALGTGILIVRLTEDKTYEKQLDAELKEKKEKAFLLHCDPHSTMNDLVDLYYPETKRSAI